MKRYACYIDEFGTVSTPDDGRPYGFGYFICEDSDYFRNLASRQSELFHMRTKTTRERKAIWKNAYHLLNPLFLSVKPMYILNGFLKSESDNAKVTSERSLLNTINYLFSNLKNVDQNYHDIIINIYKKMEENVGIAEIFSDKTMIIPSGFKVIYQFCRCMEIYSAALRLATVSLNEMLKSRDMNNESSFEIVFKVGCVGESRTFENFFNVCMPSIKKNYIDSSLSYSDILPDNYLHPSSVKVEIAQNSFLFGFADIAANLSGRLSDSRNITDDEMLSSAEEVLTDFNLLKDSSLFKGIYFY